MKIQITILGLGQIGTSIGMALGDYQDKIQRVGHDKSRTIVNQAKDLDAIDKGAITLSGSVKDTDVVILALPFQEIQPVLEHISEDLKEDALVVDTAPLKEPVIQWADQYLPERRYYVGITPVIQSAHLEDVTFGTDAARKDLFEDCLMGVVGRSGTSQEAFNAGVNLARLLGAYPFFSDPAEIDGLMTMTHILPQLLAASLLKTSQNTPGWRDARKLAGKPYHQASNAFGQDEIPGALAAALIHNRENTSRVINEMIRVLVEIRDYDESITEEELGEQFRDLQRERDLWLADRREGSWIDTPKAEIRKEGIFAQLLGIRKPKGLTKDR